MDPNWGRVCCLVEGDVLDFTAEEIEAARSQTSIEVFRGGISDLVRGTSFLDFMTALGIVMDRIPPEFQSTATIELESWDEYGSQYAEFYVSYERPELDQDVVVRLREQNSRARAKEAEQRQMYDYLKAKYEPR